MTNSRDLIPSGAVYATLFQLGPLAVPTYGTAMAVGFLCCVVLGARAGHRLGLSMDRLLDLAFFMLVGGLLGSRILYVLTNAQSFVDQCLGEEAQGPREPLTVAYECTRALYIWEGGLVFYGALVGALGLGLWYGRRHGLPFLKVADAVVPGAALGHFFGRLGCVAAGCCYGRPTGSPFGLTLPPGSVAFQELFEAGQLTLADATTRPLHPTQLYEAGAELAIFALLLGLGPRKRYMGQVLTTYLGLYAATRLVVELFRADPDRGFLVEQAWPALASWLHLPSETPLFLSTSQVGSVLLLLLALALHYLLSTGRLSSARLPSAHKKTLPDRGG